MSSSRSPALGFVAYESLGGAPNVVVDGSPCDGTVLCLSHWPGIGSPADLAADTSAEMALRYVAEGGFDRHGDAVAASNNHFDQDGLVGLFALTSPEEALARRVLLEDVARAGDFATYRSREAARVSMVIAAFADPARTLLAGLAGLAGLTDYGAQTALLYTALLPRLADLCDHVDRYQAMWKDEDAGLTASEAAVASGAVSIVEVPDLDLAVVTVTEGEWGGGGHRFAGEWVHGVHPMALHNATERGALLVLRGRHYEVRYRYESWVQYRTRAVRARVDLVALAERLNEEEPGGGAWTASPVSGLTPTLALSGAAESGLAPERFRWLVEEHLRRGAPAWDPYAVTR
jgi:hypothetical protein